MVQNNFAVTLADKVNTSSKSSLPVKGHTSDFFNVLNQSKMKVTQQNGYSAKRESEATTQSNSLQTKFDRMKKFDVASKSSRMMNTDKRRDKVEKDDDKQRDVKDAAVSDEMLAYLSQATGLSKQEIQSMLNEKSGTDQTSDADKVIQFLSQATGIDMADIKKLLAKIMMNSNREVQNLEGESVNASLSSPIAKSDMPNPNSEGSTGINEAQATGNNEAFNKLAAFLSQATGVDLSKVQEALKGQISDQNDQAVAKITDFLTKSTGVSQEEMTSLLSGEHNVGAATDKQSVNGIVFGEKLQNAEKLANVLQQDTRISSSDQQALLHKLNVFVKKLSVEFDNSGTQDPQIENMLSSLKLQTEQSADAEPVILKDVQVAVQENKTAGNRSEQTTSRDKLLEEALEGEISELQVLTGSADDTKEQSQGEEDTKEFAAAKVIKISDLNTGKIDQQAAFQQVYSNMAAEKNNTDIPVEVLKKSVNQPIFNNEEIFKQVVDNAKVTLTADKSEMIMHLRPESLGKLTMKVVTERGLMIAQFTAESQQVKQIIEANLPQLKDALESQGLNVQGFSVSVGQEDTSKQQYERNNAPKVKRVSNLQGNTVLATAGYDTGYTINNPYKFSDSSVDFQA